MIGYASVPAMLFDYRNNDNDVLPFITATRKYRKLGRNGQTDRRLLDSTGDVCFACLGSYSLFCITTILHNKTCRNVLSTVSPPTMRPMQRTHGCYLPSLLSPPSSTAPPAVQYSPDTHRSSLPFPPYSL